MTLDIIIVFSILLGAVVLFAKEIVPPDLTAVMVLCALVFSNVLTLKEGFSGLSHTGTVAVVVLLILGEAVNRSGALLFIVKHFQKLSEKQNSLFLIFLLIISATVSAFISNIAAIMIFMPVVLSVTRAQGKSPSPYLLPLAYASMLGGVCTLIGSSTNIVLSEYASHYGMERFGMFEFSLLGIACVVAGFVYLLIFAPRLLPDRPVTHIDLTEHYRIREYLTDLSVPDESPLVGTTFYQEAIQERFDIELVGLVRKGLRIWEELDDIVFRPGDVLMLHGRLSSILRFQKKTKLTMKQEHPTLDLDDEDTELVEGVLAPTSFLVGRTLKDVDFHRRYGVFAIALRKADRTYADTVGRIPLHVGDTLLIYGRKEAVHALRRSTDFLLFETITLPGLVNKRKAILSIAVMAAVVTTAALGWLPLVKAGLGGVVLLAVTRTLSLDQIYRAINWKIVFMLAGVIPLGLAMEKSGAADLLAGGLVTLAKPFGALVVLSAIFWIASLFSEVIQNTPAAILLAPLAVSTAESMDMDPRAFLIMVLFGVSTCFASPTSYHVNAIVYSPGGYRVSDYIKLGSGLKIIIYLIVIWTVPRLWPL